MTGLAKNIASLMDEWAEFHKDKGLNCFISDGAVNADAYQKSNPKIVFFLKEAYSKNNDENWSLTDWLNGGAMTKMWSTVSEWTYGIRNTTSSTIPQKPRLTRGEKIDLLKTIAIVNVKKSNGKSTSTYADLLNFVKSDLLYLKKELEILSPDIIVCGNNSSLLRAIYGANIQKDKVDSTGLIDADFMRQNGYALIDNHIIVDFYHPANQYPSILNYYSICGIYQQALKAKG